MSKNAVSIWVAIIGALGVIIAAAIALPKFNPQPLSAPPIIINNTNISRSQASDDASPPTPNHNAALVQVAATNPPIQPTLTFTLPPPTETATPVPATPLPTNTQTPTSTLVPPTKVPTAEAASTPLPTTSSEVRITVDGMGAAPDTLTDPGRRERAAILAAEVDAKRKLAEWIAGAQIEAVTIVSQGTLVTDTIRQTVQARVPAPKTIQQNYDSATGTAHVILELVIDEE